MSAKEDTKATETSDTANGNGHHDDSSETNANPNGAASEAKSKNGSEPVSNGANGTSASDSSKNDNKDLPAATAADDGLEIFVKSSHKAVKDFIENLKNDDIQTNDAVVTLIDDTSGKRKWSLIKLNEQNYRLENNIDLACGIFTIQEKSGKQSTDNTLVLVNEQLTLWHAGKNKKSVPITEPDLVADILNYFYNGAPRAFVDFEALFEQYTTSIPALVEAWTTELATLRETNSSYKSAFNSFFAVCSDGIYDRLKETTADELLGQHLFIVKLLDVVLGYDVAKENYIAQLAEQVWKTIPKDKIDRAKILKDQKDFWSGVDAVSKLLDDQSAKQKFLTTLYDRVIAGERHSRRHQTDATIVSLMWQAVEQIMSEDLELKFEDKSVKVLDVSTGLGEFITDLLHRVDKKSVPQLYKEQIFANEASLFHFYLGLYHIEQAYAELADKPAKFTNMALADTLDLKKKIQMMMMLFRVENDTRLDRQQDSDFTIIIGNTRLHSQKHPEKRNRYRGLKRDIQPSIDDVIEDDYVSQSKNPNAKTIYEDATRFIKWAEDRLGDKNGVICLLGAHDLVASPDWDGVRASLHEKFDLIYQLGLDDGKAITVLARVGNDKSLKYHHKMPDSDLASIENWQNIDWKRLYTNPRNGWHVLNPLTVYQAFKPIDDIFVKSTKGLSTRRDTIVYDFNRDALKTRIEKFIEDFNNDVDKYQDASDKAAFAFNTDITWNKTLKDAVKQGKKLKFDDNNIREAVYRPYAKRYVYFADIINEDRDKLPSILPNEASTEENRLICIASNKSIGFAALMTNAIPDMNLFNTGIKCFPFYTYNKKGEAQENISDEALGEFQEFYQDDGLTKWDIFYYIYGTLHHKSYLKDNTDSLIQALPRVPFAAWFYDIADIGYELAQLHLNYEHDDMMALEEDILEGKEKSYLVNDKMRLNKERTAVRINNTLILRGIDPAKIEYRIGKRTVLAWVIDQYREKLVDRSGITSNPNRDDDPQFITNLVKRVLHASGKTIQMVGEMPPLFDE